MSSFLSPASHVYRGRFAPSPTGDLHMGSLIAAVASYLEARTRQGEWLLRMEDLDPPRIVPGSADRILAALEAFGFEWNGEVLYQSKRHEAYREAIDTLRQQGEAFDCACSRSDIAENAERIGPEGPIYPGTCRDGIPLQRKARSIRVHAPVPAIRFEDRLRGNVCQDVAAEIGDFVIRRADGYFAYQLAVVVDDAWQNITDVVRGADLLLSTPRQIGLQRQLGMPTPGYMHIPLLLDETGRKLSKQNRSLPVDPTRASSGLYDALSLLRQAPPPVLAKCDPPEIWAWAVENWRPQRLRDLHELSTPCTDPR